MGELPESWHLISDLAPWERNARAHSDESTRRLVAGIRRFGFLVPITAWRAEKRIAAGHGRRLAMLSILREDPSFVPRNAPTGTLPGMVPVMWEDFASEAQYEAFAISDNRQAKNAQDDGEAIAAILREMDADGLDFAGMGFGDEEIASALQAMPDIASDGLDDMADLNDPTGITTFRASVPTESRDDIEAAIEAWGAITPEKLTKEHALGAMVLHWWHTHGL
jgi:ParB-like chromosome segregation protein Spo0J